MFTRRQMIATLTALAAPALGGDPTLGWHTLETEHFIVHYHDRQGDMPQRVALYCEEAHIQLMPLLDWLPAEKTHVIIDDRVDTANGSAVIVPRNTIRLFLTGPPGRGSLGDYDDWLRGLIIHEYVHILHIDTIDGLPAILNEILGKRASPNQLLPRWFTEGMATYHESARTGGGRVRSSLFHMYLRTAYLDGNFFDLGTLTGLPYDWPRGAAPYLYGSHFLAYVAETRGEEFFRAFNHKYGGRYIPYSMNITAREVVGEDFEQLYAEWFAHIAGTYEAQLMAIRAAGVTPVERLTENHQSSHTPRARPGTRQVSFFSASGRDSAGIYTHDLDSEQIEPLVVHGSVGGPHWWDPTGRYVIFNTSVLLRNTYAYNDLVMHDVQTGVEERLTRGLRARDPAFDPQGRRVVFVENDAGRTHLALFDLQTGQRRRLIETTTEGQFDTPVFDPSGRFIAVSYWPDRRGRDIYVYDTQHERLVRLTADRAIDLEPTFSPDGKYLVFSSDRTRVYDIYAIETQTLAGRVDGLVKRYPDKTLEPLDLPIWRVSRVERGLFTPQIVQDGDRQWLYVSTFGVYGFDLGRMPFDPERFLGPAPPSQIKRPSVAAPVVPEPVITEGPDTYRPALYLLPRSVGVLMAFTNGGRGSYGLELLGFDPVGFHSWFLAAEYFEETENAFVAANYSYSRLPVSLGVGFQFSTYERTRSLVAGSTFVPFTEQAIDAQLSLGIPLPSIRATHNLSLGYNLRFTDFFDDPPVVAPEPVDLSPRQPEQGNFSSVTLSYFVGDNERYGQSITTENGYSVNLSLRYRDRITGADVRSVRATYSTAFYVQNPWLSNHVTQFRLRGGFERTNFRGPNRFAIGGAPPQELVSAIINETPLGGTFLRGFRPGTAVGQQFHVASVEYRFPIWIIQSGFGTLPFNIGRLGGSVYADYGSAFSGRLPEARFFAGNGAELLLETTFGYALPLFFRMGYAHGYGSEGIDDFYLYLGSSY